LSYLGDPLLGQGGVFKAIGLGMHAPMSWRSCEVINVPGGRPEIRLRRARTMVRAAPAARLRQCRDEANVATAFVVVEKVSES
jgi:holo-[acyl-carrier protein] synthase